MMEATIFDIKEFALNDGDGIRTTVFFKGCPLRCIWCHNPEGLSPVPELYVKQNGCKACGLCKKECTHDECKPFGRCIHVCPADLVTVVGKKWSVDALAEKLLAQRETLSALGGGITLSGGEPMMQWEFVHALLQRLYGKVHTTIETSGFCGNDEFKKVTKLCDHVYMDIKLFDSLLHKKYTGVSNDRILSNARILIEHHPSYTFRIPLIPGITDTEENLCAISSFVGSSHVELLPYNKLAPAKYRSVGREFTDLIDPDKATAPRTELFTNAVLRK